MPTTNVCTPTTPPDHPQDDVRSRKRNVAMVLSAVCTTMLLGLSGIVAVEQLAPQSALAGWLRQSSCAHPVTINLGSNRNHAVQSKRRKRRRLEDQQDKDNGDNEGGEGDEESKSEDEGEEDNEEGEEENQKNQDDYYGLADDAAAGDDAVAGDDVVAEDDDAEQEVLQTYPPGM